MSDTVMLISPRMSEKAYLISETRNAYSLVVPGDANKQTIAAAVAARFKVTVLSVNIVNTKGKQKRTIRLGSNRAVSGQGRRSNVKKAYVTLKEGDKLPFFIEPDAKPEETKKSATRKKKD